VADSPVLSVSVMMATPEMSPLIKFYLEEIREARKREAE
jgi:hypothetical protein